MLIKYNGDVIPCCTHRATSQYREDPNVDARVLGNVFSTSVLDVWNCHRYQSARRLVAKPERINTDPALETSFCYGCPELFETTKNQAVRTGEIYDLREVHPQVQFIALNRERPITTA
jgi:hypothetical protein